MRVEDVQTGEIMIIKPGERIPLDGEVLSGDSTIDTKILTGESVPVNVTKGEMVLSGCININGLLTVKVTKLASESTVSKILEMVENATSKKHQPRILSLNLHEYILQLSLRWLF